MKICIICRENKNSFNDEHVIPDSIQGYYHIYSVCVDCNSRLGGKIDSALINHKFIEFQRHLLNIKGKDSEAPNPFRGTHNVKNQPNEKVRLEVNENGEFVPILLPIIPNLKKESIIDSFTIVLDKKDEKQIDEIVKKVLTRSGIDKSKVLSSTTEHSQSFPQIQMQLKIDTHDFKAGMLKIAYEFAVDSIPKYFDDPLAIIISRILHDGDFENLTSKIQFLGNGFDKKVLEPFEHMIDFSNNNHYLILITSESGLLCFVNLFNVFSIGILLSNQDIYLKNDIIVGKNDIANHTFKKFSLNELFSEVYSPMQYRFQYHFDTQNECDDFIKLQKLPDFNFFYEDDGKIAFYNYLGNKIYDDIDNKLITLQSIPHGDTKNKIVNEYILDEDLYIKHLPSNALYRVTAVESEQHNTGKI